MMPSFIENDFKMFFEVIFGELFNDISINLYVNQLEQMQYKNLNKNEIKHIS